MHPRRNPLFRAAATVALVVGVLASTATPVGATDATEETQTSPVVVRVPDAPDGRPRFVAADATAEQIEQWAAHPYVTSVEPDGVGRLAEMPDDPYVDEQIEHELSGVARAWSHSTGSGQVIAVLDTGVARDPDLTGRILPGTSFTDGTWADDRHGHGTRVALVAAAAHGNGVGGAGVCPDCRILPVQVARANGTVSWSAAASGVLWAVDQGADIVNLSFGGTSHSTVLEDAIHYASKRGVLVIAAAGNSASDAEFYPAAFDNVVSVGGHDANDDRYSFSNFGPWVDIAAPGCVFIAAEGAAGGGCGTSYSSPYVAGLAALVMAHGDAVGHRAVAAAVEGAVRPLTWVRSGAVDGTDLLAAPEPAPLVPGESTPDAPHPAGSHPFHDIDPDAYYADAVTWLAATGTTTGTTHTTYSPHAPLTRAQIATLLWRAAGQPHPDASHPFHDIDPDAYYADAVTWLAATGTTTGTTHTTYSPHAPLTRAQIATLLWRAAGQPHPGTSVG